MSTLVIRHGPVRRGRRTVLEAGSITVALPAAAALVGVNGSGKSSLFMHLADNLLGQPAAARICIDGRAPRLASVPQVPALPGWMRPDEVARLYGHSFAAMVDEMPGLHLGELAGQPVRMLSVGQNQALAVAIALAGSAPLTLLDEPFAALDFRRRIGLLDMLHARLAADRDAAIMISSQSAPDLLELCEHIVVIRAGRYIFNGARDELGAPGELAAMERRLLQLLT